MLLFQLMFCVRLYYQNTLRYGHLMYKVFRQENRYDNVSVVTTFSLLGIN